MEQLSNMQRGSDPRSNRRHGIWWPLASFKVWSLSEACSSQMLKNYKASKIGTLRLWSPESFRMLWLFFELLSQGPLLICSYCWWGTETSFPISSNFRNKNPQKDAGLVVKALKPETNREIISVDAGADLTLGLLQSPFWCTSCSPWSSPCAGRSSGLLVHKTLWGRQAR